MKHPWLEAIFLAVAALAIVAAVFGVFAMRGAAARLHYVGAAGLLAPPFLAAAVVAEQGFSSGAIKTVLVATLLAAQSPVIAHLAARMILSERLPPARRRRTRS